MNKNLERALDTLKKYCVMLKEAGINNEVIDQFHTDNLLEDGRTIRSRYISLLKAYH